MIQIENTTQLKQKLKHTKKQLEQTHTKLKRTHPQKQQFTKITLNIEKYLRENNTEQLEHTMRTIRNYKNKYKKCVTPKQRNLINKLEITTAHLYINTNKITNNNTPR